MKSFWGTPFVGPKNDSEEPFLIETCEKKTLHVGLKSARGTWVVPSFVVVEDRPCI